MQHLFLNKKLSILAEEKGFDEPCFGFYFEHPTTKQYVLSLQVVKKVTKGTKSSLAPLYQQIIDWFREKHSIDININRLDNEGFYYPTLLTNNKGLDWLNVWEGKYYEALNKAIEEAFKLI